MNPVFFNTDRDGTCEKTYFRCAGCDSLLSAVEDMAGTEAVCLGCGQPLVIPEPPRLRLLQLLAARPFQAFRVVLVSGKRRAVTHPELCTVVGNKVAIETEDAAGSHELYFRCGSIARLELLEAGQ